MKNKLHKSSFTLIELIVYMGLVSIILLTISQLFVTVLGSKLESEALSSVVQDGRYILARLTYDINRAKDITSPVNIGESNATLQIINNDSGTDNNYSYYLQNGNLILNNNFGLNQLNSIDTQISNLNFTRLGNPAGKNSIKFSFTITSKIIKQSGFELENFETTVNLR